MLPGSTSSTRFRVAANGDVVARRAAVWALGCTLPILLLAGADARTSDGASTERFLQREEPLTQYRAYRRMHARNDRFNQEGWLEAWTEYDHRGFRYEIVNERGSDYVRTRVLKAVLKWEQELIAAGDNGRAELSAANYNFEEASGGTGERYVRIKPKRRDVLLVDGRMVLSQDGRELLRVEGKLSKNPSFWMSLVNVIRHYARLDGIRVPISTESSAKLKFAGVSHLEVHCEYETINGRSVSLEARRTIAQVAAR
jgi:hypothetical protein